MFARFTKILDRAALTILLAVAAVPILAMPALAVAAAHTIH